MATNYWKKLNPLTPDEKIMIGSIIEEYISNGYSIVDVSAKFNRTTSQIGSYLSNYWFPYTGEDGILLTLESKINKPEEELQEV